MLATLTAWTASIGYIKVLAATGKNVKPLFNVDMEQLKALQLRTAGDLLKQPE